MVRNTVKSTDKGIVRIIVKCTVKDIMIITVKGAVKRIVIIKGKGTIRCITTKRGTGVLGFRLVIIRGLSNRGQMSQSYVNDGLFWRGLKRHDELTSVSAGRRVKGGLWTRRLLDRALFI